MPRRLARPSPFLRPPRCCSGAGLSLRLSVALTALFVGIAASGCKSGKSPRPERQPERLSDATSAGGAFTALETTAPVLSDRPLLLALRWDGDPAQAPATVDARTDAGRTIALPVRGVGVRPNLAATDGAMRFPHWRWSAAAYEMVELDGAAEIEPAAFFAIIKEPDAWPGVGVNIGTSRVVLVPVTADPGETSSAPLPASGGFDQPHPTSPFEAVRRALWRRQANRNLPAGQHDEDSLLSMLSRQTAGRWCAALRDLAAIDPELTTELEQLLTRTAWDGSTRFAAWPADTAQLLELESILLARLTEAPHDEEWRLRVRAWLARQPTAVPWIESDSGMRLFIACANLSSAAARATISDARRPAIWMLEMGPLSVGRTNLNRQTESISDRIIVQVGDENRTLALVEPVAIVLPPGLVLDSFWQNWTLATWLNGRPDAPDPRRKTAVLVRRSPTTQRWELTITCTLDRPLGETALDATFARQVLSERAGWEELVGHESVTVVSGYLGQPFEVLSVLPDGSARSWRGTRDLLPGAVHVEVESGLWRVTVALPDVSRADSDFDFGVVRMHEGRDAVDCLPRPALPWKHDPGRVRVDLSRWDALPDFALPAPGGSIGGGE